MNDYDYTGHRYAYRCDKCGELLPPGKTKGLCTECQPKAEGKRSRKGPS